MTRYKYVLMSFIPALAAAAAEISQPAVAGVAAMNASPALSAGALALGSSAIAGSLTAGMNSIMPGSGNVTSTPVDLSSAPQVEVSAFIDANADVQKVTMPVRDNPTVNFDHDIYHFLGQPIYLTQFEWRAGTAPIDINPWNAYFNNPAVKRKLANYAFISGKLKMKVECTGNAFQYGKATYGFLPTGNVYRTAAGGLTQYAISNLPLQFNIDPSRNTVVEIDVPWTLRREADMVNVATADLGSFVSYIPAPLASVSTGSLAPYVTITIFGSLHDVKLQFRTSVIPVSDYAGVLSKPLQQAAQTAAAFKNVPVIGPYADTFSQTAKTASTMTTLFGFSAPNNVEQVHNQAMKLTGNMASTIMQDTGDVMAFDPRATTIMDPRLVGLPGVDEMAISALVTRYSQIFALAWNDTQTRGANLLSTWVSPFMTGQTYPFAPSHVAYHTLAFKYFRGTLRLKFQVPCTTFHSGKLQIIFDPLNPPSAEDPTNLTQNIIWDLKNEQEVVMEIPFANAYLANYLPNNVLNWSTLIQSTQTGVLRVNVLNPLRANGTATTVQLLVYIAAGDDWELMCPTFENFVNAAGSTRLTYWPVGTASTPGATIIPGFNNTPPVGPGLVAESEEITLTNQSDEADLKQPIVDLERRELFPTSEVLEVANKEAEFVSMKYSELVQSERILSWRNVIKRYTPGRPLTLRYAAGQTYYSVMYDFPKPPIYTQPLGSTAQQYTRESYNFLNFLAPCYWAYRGSIRHKYVDVQGVFQKIGAMRSFQDYPATGYAWSPPFIVDNFNRIAVSSGTQIVDATYSALEFTLPFYARVYANQSPNNPGLLTDGRSSHIVFGTPQCKTMPITTNQAVDLDHYVAAGDDFTFLLYLGPPVVYFTAF